MTWQDPATWMYWFAWAIAAAGVGLLILGWRGRAKPAHWCRRCDYDLTGLPSETVSKCPECGRDPDLSKRPGRKRRRWLAAVGVMLLSPLVTKRLWVEPSADAIWKHLLPQQVAIERFADGGLEWELFADRGDRSDPPDDWFWMPFAPGVRLHHPMAGVIELGDGDTLFTFRSRETSVEDVAALEPRDVTGDGVAEVLVYSWSGGAHCCMTLYLIDTRASHDAIISIQGEHSLPTLGDFDNDGVYEVGVQDWTFAYWGTSFAASPSVEVILTTRNGKPCPRADLMRKPPPSPDAISAAVQSFRSHRKTDPLAIFWRPMLDWIYTGNEQAAWDYLDAIWDEDLEKRFGTKQSFRDSFVVTLNSSRWWPALRDQYAAMAANEKAR